ncbi:RNA helicase [Lithospermum erythrorhizon]|uniref:RNA helicase n=1 Tax=Lithospermum erythrorhizon TaxID=34254 RepID=A0AAV3P4H8_LITER
MLQGYIDFFMDLNLADCYLKLKDELAMLLQRKMQDPVTDIHKEGNYLLLAVQEVVCLAGGQCEGRFVFGRQSRRLKESNHSYRFTRDGTNLKSLLFRIYIYIYKITSYLKKPDCLQKKILNIWKGDGAFKSTKNVMGKWFIFSNIPCNAANPTNLNYQKMINEIARGGVRFRGPTPYEITHSILDVEIRELKEYRQFQEKMKSM